MLCNLIVSNGKKIIDIQNEWNISSYFVSLSLSLTLSPANNTDPMKALNVK